MATFLQNLDVFLPKTGLENGHIAWWLAGVQWPADAARDDFVDATFGVH